MSAECSDGCLPHLRHGTGGVTTGFSIIHLFAAEGIRDLSILICPGGTGTKVKAVTTTHIWHQQVIAIPPQKTHTQETIFFVFASLRPLQAKLFSLFLFFPSW